eukprot:6178904-Pleurochrysis_carterae.AAC.1
MERVGLGCRTAATHLRISLMSIIRWQYVICDVDSQVRRTSLLQQNCTITARKARSFSAADGGGEFAQNSLINFERVGDVPSWSARRFAGLARRFFAGLAHSSLDHLPAKAWLISCGDNPEADMASNRNTDTLDAGQRESAGPNLSALVRELAVFVHAAAIGGDYDADRMIALATALQRETPRERGRSAAPAATYTDVLPVSEVRATAVAPSTPATVGCCICRNQYARPCRCFSR